MKNDLLSTTSRDTLGWQMELHSRAKRKGQAQAILKKFEDRQTEIDARAAFMATLLANERKALRRAAEAEGVEVNKLSVERMKSLLGMS